MEWIEAFRSDGLTLIMRGFTFLGDEEFFLLALPLAYWLWKPSAMGRLGIILLATVVINDFIKTIIQDPRPSVIPHLVEAEGWNFPSGHAQSAMVLWGWLAWELRKRWFAVVAGILISGVAISRVYLGVHDVPAIVGGLLFGGLSLLLYGWLLKQRPHGWMVLGGARQGAILFVILLGAYMLFPEHGEGALKGGAAFIGFTSGYLVLRQKGAVLLDFGIGASVARTITGLVGILFIYIGLKQAFLAIGYTTAMATWIRYGLLGFWISWGAMQVYLKSGWAAMKHGETQASA